MSENPEIFEQSLLKNSFNSLPGDQDLKFRLQGNFPQTDSN